MPRPPALDAEGTISPAERAQYTPLLASGELSSLEGGRPKKMCMHRAATSMRLGEGKTFTTSRTLTKELEVQLEVADIAPPIHRKGINGNRRAPHGSWEGKQTFWRSEERTDFFSRCRRRGSSLIILPEETGCWLSAWDLFMGFTALCVAFYEPYSLTLVADDRDRVMNMLLDCLLVLDVALQFFVAFPYSTESNSSALWETDPVLVAQRYMNVPFSYGMTGGWFWLDMLSVLPGWTCRHGSDPLAILRLLRLLRMMRLARLKRLMDEWHKVYGYSYNMVEVLKFMMVTTLTVHWLACLWIAVEGKITRGPISYTAKPNEESWLQVMIATKGDTCYPDVYGDETCVYLFALYWATMTLTGVGYGDVTPQNKMEYAVCVFCMLISGYAWAYVVGSIVSILSSLDPQEVTFRQHTDELSALMRNRELSQDLQKRLRGYMHAAQRVSRLRGQRTLLKDNISCGLQREVASNSGVVQCLVDKIFWARDLEPEAIYDIVRALWPCYFGPQETMAMRQTLAVIRRGVAVYKGRFMSRDDVWGHEDILLESDYLLEKVMPKTLSYVEILQLTKMDLIQVCSNFHQADKRIRKAQIRVAVRRGVCDAARRMRASKKVAFPEAGAWLQPHAHFSTRRDNPRQSEASSDQTLKLHGLVREMTMKQETLLNEVRGLSSAFDTSTSSSSPLQQKRPEMSVHSSWALTPSHFVGSQRLSERNGSRRSTKDSRSCGARSTHPPESPPRNRRGAGKDVL